MIKHCFTLLLALTLGCAGNLPDYGPEIEGLKADIEFLRGEVDSLWYYSDVQGFLIEAVYGELVELRELRLPDGSVYEIRPGDNLWKIAESKLGDGWRWVEIYVLNYWTIREPDLVFPGQVITVRE